MKDLSRRSFLGASGATLLSGTAGPLWADGQARPGAAAEPPASSPARTGQNIVCFMPDTLRADALGCYGNSIAQTPNFDRLARQSTLFEQCHAQYPICGPSRCSMLTGWPTSVRGHRSQMYFLRPHEPNLFRDLHRAGYDVFWAGKNDALAARSFEDSVTAWNLGARESDAAPAGRSGSINNQRKPPGPLTFIGDGPTGDRRSGEDYRNLQAAIRILNRRQTPRPFFLFIPIVAPHPPYNSPPGFAGLHSPADVTGLIPADLPNRPAHLQRMLQAYGLDSVSPDVYRKIRAAYLDKVSYVDWLLGELLEAIERTNHTADTSLLVLSDHGDYAGDFGLVEKWPSGMERCLTHVPFLARVPGGRPGHRVPEPIELFDMMATSLELAGAHASHTHFARSQVAQIFGAHGDPARGAFTEGGFNSYEPQCYEPVPPKSSWYYDRLNLQIAEPQTASRVAAVRTVQYTFVSRSQGVSELYLRKDDPQERHNRFGDKSLADVQHEAEVRLLHWYTDTTGIAPMNRDPRGFPEIVPMPDFPPHTQDRILDEP
jgi:arylsulfatase A-like enzyme